VKHSQRHSTTYFILLDPLKSITIKQLASMWLENNGKRQKIHYAGYACGLILIFPITPC